jgi:hypothetical protein
MTRKTMKTVLLVLLAIFTLGSVSEAAPRKTVRHRVRHSRRVAAAARKPAVRKSQAKRVAPTAKSKRVVKRKTTTKPH